MSCVTGFLKKRFKLKPTPLAMALVVGVCGFAANDAFAQQYPQQYQQMPGQGMPQMLPGGYPQAMPQTLPAGYPQGQPPQLQGNYAPPQGQGAQLNSAERAQTIGQWFKSYDEIRRKAQMTPAERAKADGLMSKALAMFIPGEEKVQAQKLLSSLVARYAQAVDEMKRLPLYPETDRLHRGYYQYFSTARQLFSDYLTVQQNPLATDANGTPIAGTLMARKQALEGLDQANKGIDGQLRSQFGIPPYQY